MEASGAYRYFYESLMKAVTINSGNVSILPGLYEDISDYYEQLERIHPVDNDYRAKQYRELPEEQKEAILSDGRESADGTPEECDVKCTKNLIPGRKKALKSKLKQAPILLCAWYCLGTMTPEEAESENFGTMSNATKKMLIFGRPVIRVMLNRAARERRRWMPHMKKWVTGILQRSIREELELTDLL